MADSWAVRYRPQTFESLTGNERNGKILREAVLRHQEPPAIFLAGTRGSGKTTSARIYAKAICCEHLTPEGEPCNECDTCKDIMAGSYPEVIELDAASENSVQGVRDLIKTLGYLPTRGNRKVVILDECHAFSQAATNALLKTLEEPPEFVRFVFCTTDPQKVLETIRSRCLMFRFNDITATDIVKRLRYIADQEHVNIDDHALATIARNSNGGMRDSIMLLEQAFLVKSQGELIKASDILELIGSVSVMELQKLFTALKEPEPTNLLNWLDQEKFAPADVLSSAISFLETIIMIKQGVSPASFVSKDQVAGVMSLASTISFQDVTTMFDEFRGIVYDLRSLSMVNTATLFRLRLVGLQQKLNGSLVVPGQASSAVPQQKTFMQMVREEFHPVRIPVPTRSA